MHNEQQKLLSTLKMKAWGREQETEKKSVNLVTAMCRHYVDDDDGNVTWNKEWKRKWIRNEVNKLNKCKWHTKKLSNSYTLATYNEYTETTKYYTKWIIEYTLEKLLLVAGGGDCKWNNVCVLCVYFVVFPSFTWSALEWSSHGKFNRKQYVTTRLPLHPWQTNKHANQIKLLDILVVLKCLH